MSGCLAPARFFRYTAAEKDPISEVPEVPHPEADALEDLRFVVAALDEAVGPGDVHGVQNLLKPVAVRRDAGLKFRKIHTHGKGFCLYAQLFSQERGREESQTPNIFDGTMIH